MTTTQQVMSQPKRADVRTKPAAKHEPGNTPSWMPGLAVGGVAAVASRMTSLVPRRGWQNWAATAVCAGAGFGLGSGINALANGLDSHSDSLNSTTSKLLFSGAGVTAALGASVALRGHPNADAVKLIGTTGLLTAGVGVTSLAIDGERHLTSDLSDTTAVGAGAASGLALMAGAGLLLKHTRASAVAPDVAARYEAEVLSEIPKATTFDEAGWARLTEQRARMTTVSGGTGSLLPRESLNTYAKLFVDNATPPEEIERVMGAAGTPIQSPVRVYGGFRHADSHQELADKMLAETIRLGGFDRSHLVLYVPSGTGTINQQATMSLEHLMRGDVTSVGMQYGELPSVKSLSKLPDASKLFDTVRQTFVDHAATLPENQRPKISAFAESLGSWAMQDAIRAHGDATHVRDLGLDKILNVGTPGFSKLRSEAIGQQGHKLDASGSMYEFGLASELEQLTPAEREKITTYLFSHYDDAVSRANLKTLYVRPPWLENQADGIGIPTTMKWWPGGTGIHSIFDLINGISSGPGRAHNYGANMPRVSNLLYDTGASETQIGRINEAVEQYRLHETRLKAKA